MTLAVKIGMMGSDTIGAGVPRLGIAPHHAAGNASPRSRRSLGGGDPLPSGAPDIASVVESFRPCICTKTQTRTCVGPYTLIHPHIHAPTRAECQQAPILISLAVAQG